VEPRQPVVLVAGISEYAAMKCVEVLLRCPVVDGVIMLGLMPALSLEPFSKSASEDVREQLREAILAGITRIFGRLNGLAQRYNRPTIVASEPLAFGASLADRIIRILVERNSVCYDMPYQETTAFASLAQ
jgi:hypothetical protein